MLNNIEKVDKLIATKPELKIAEGRNIPSPFNISEKGGRLYISQDEESPQLVTTTPPFINEQYIDIETGQYSYAIEFITQDQRKEKTVNAEQISQVRQVRELANFGLDVDDNNARNVMKFFTEYKRFNKLPILQTASRLGHIKSAFISPRQSNTKIVTVEAGHNSLLKAFNTKGDIKGYCEKVFKPVCNNAVVMCMMYGAVGSVLLHDLGQEPFIIDLAGLTSTGKSTALRVASSVWGSKSLIFSWNMTKVAIERYTTFLNSFPLLLDDTRNAIPYVVSDTIYQFSSGQSKGRGNKTGVNAQTTWDNILLSTGEASIVEYGKEKGGLSARAITIEAPPFCTDFNFIGLYNSLDQYFGHLGFKCIDVFNENKEKYQTIFHEHEKQFIKRAGNNPVLIRLARPFAVLACAGAVINDVKGFEHDYIQNVSWAFSHMLENNKTVDKPTELLSNLLEKLDSDRSGIIGENYYHNENIPVSAVYKKELLGITANTVKTFLGIEYKAITKAWHDKGYLYCCNKGEIQKSIKENDKVYRSYAIDNEVIQKLGYDFAVDNPNEADDGDRLID